MDEKINPAELDINKIMKVIENPLRRELIKTLSQESNYALQLAKNMGYSQQQISKHLKTMEKSGLVDAIDIESPEGPKRIIYTLSKSFSINIDVAPNLYKEEIISFSIEPGKEKMSEDSLSFMERKNDVVRDRENKDKIKSLAQIINEIDDEIERLKNERTLLLYVRNSVMHEISRIYKDIDDTDSRMLIYRSIDRNERNIKEISKQLNLREDKVSELISKIKKTLKTNYF